VTAETVAGLIDEVRGEMVCAVVRRSQFVDERGPMQQKWPERLLFVDEFPLTGLGKVAKAELAQLVSGGSQ
jgi:cyclohexanecarboxylate-CoA ligase